ncbi:EAL domain-containing protein [Cytobacillus sp. FJAT-54145]|uniref:EAL domain-containing protein n=1 Tax=Cytobacillus spartinae TaxID=3299023 RepID=A0ABW6KIR1_9BACI
MDNKCVHCGISFQIHHSGYLFVWSHEKLSSPFEKEDNECWRYEYDTIHNLENILSKLEVQFGEKCREIKCGLTRKSKKPYTTYTLKNLKARVANKELVEVIQNGELISHIQPIIDLQQANQIYGYESLLRTNQEKPVPPGMLFKAAEETGMLSLLDQRAREAAIKARKKFIKEGVKSFINFLPSTIYNPDFCLRHTFYLVDLYEINPNDLVFEVVETEKIEDIDHLKSVLSTYKREGMKVALDDVGSGFSTLETLKLLNPDYVKIDRSYVDHCDQNSEKQRFLLNVLQISRDLGIKVLAEGIERKEELEFCQSIGVDLAQGYFIGKPSNPAINGGELVGVRSLT